MFYRSLKPLIAAVVMSAALTPALAVIAQEPLLNRPNSVSPNLVLILDTSGSMDASNGTYIYQYGTIDSSGMGPQGPGGSYASKSPDINRIYYDPRVRYAPRVDYLGNNLPVTVPVVSGSSRLKWNVYFRKTSGPYVTGDLQNATDYYNPYAPPASMVVTGSIANYPTSVDSGAITTYPKFIARTDCVTPTAATAISCTPLEEAQNYSNWNKWYSSRGIMAVTGIGAAFQPLKADSIRLGWSTISNLNGSSTLDRGVASYDDAVGGVKSQFFTWLYGRTFSSGTPNLVALDRVGKYYERTDSDGPWSTLPNPASRGIATVTASGPGKEELPADHASCRRSFDMLVTDGYWNGTQPSTAGNRDNMGFSISPAVGPAFVYTPSFPYKDSASNTMADIAMYYWGRDLRGDLANRVPVINTGGINNPSTWQNVSFYAVTLGIDGTLPHNSATLASLTSGATPWPTPVANQPTTIDDTWHATINGHGDLLNASNASELTNGLHKMFATIAGVPKTLSGVSVSTTFLKSGTRKYKPEYVSGTWSGRLSAIELDAHTGNDKSPAHIYWQVETDPTPGRDPVSTIPPAASRNIFTWNGSSAVSFTAANVTVTSTGSNTNLVNYLRGDPSNELRKGGTYRDRDAILGDIVNSSPAFILDNVDLSYDKLVGSFGDYRAFVATKAARTEGVLFVGANDGMLHGFRDGPAGSADNCALCGLETFAFVPKAVVPNLSKLADTPYIHQYYVDGPNAETDAYLNNSNSIGGWNGVLLGTTGAGAKAVYALDVTNPLAMSASKVMWEVNSAVTGFSNLGYVLSDVQAGILGSDQWVAIFGNGFGSTSGAASLFVVNLQNGTVLKEIAVDSSGNGLGGVRLVRDATNRVVGAYAGDLKGNMWKFDLTGTSANWKVGLSGSALYAAGPTQPITATPAVVAHPSGGYVVAFGSGKFFETSDTISPFVTQRLYGVWDAQPFGATSTPAGAAVTGLGPTLVQQTISTVPAGTPPVNFYSVSANAVTWGNGLAGVRGWYIDLPNSGQRVAYPVERLSGTFILATTLSPVSTAEADLCVQTGSGSGWAYIIDAVTGSGPTKKTVDTNGDGKIDSGDVLVNGWQDPVDGRPTPITIESTKLKDTYCIVTAQNTCTHIELLCGQVGAKACPAPLPAGLKSREWRQLFMR